MSAQTLAAALLGPNSNGRNSVGEGRQEDHSAAFRTKREGDSHPSDEDHHMSSPSRKEHPAPISYEGMVSVMAASSGPESSPPNTSYGKIRHNYSGEISTTGDDDSSPPSHLDLRRQNPNLAGYLSNHQRPSSPPSSDQLNDDADEMRGNGMRLAYPSSSSDGRDPEDSLLRLREICEQGVKQPAIKDHCEGRGVLQDDGQTLFQCHLCTFTSFVRDDFNEHMNSHYEFICPKCEFDTQDENLWKEHLRDEHQCTPEDLEDEQGVKVPRVNSQGKVKTFKCKKCDFVSVTKSEFWKHSRQHIKPEKMLNCPKCVFVTEYKHHLEYHLRNHFGAKPLKCPNCNYTCVNKSMLNSHMKSHITVYMYRCADCNYATKYCHSLKLHLRKYAHKPDIVLNSDGTPNPLPIIDVYGTRRGPKRKPEESGGITNLEDCHYINNNRNKKGKTDSGDPLDQQKRLDDGGGKEKKKQRNPSSTRSSPPPKRAAHRDTSSSPARKSSDTSKQLLHDPMQLPAPYVMAQMQHLQKAAAAAVAASRMVPQGFPQPPTGVPMEHSPVTSPYSPSQSSHSGYKCTICSFETGSREIYGNHMMFHAAKDSPPPQPIHPIERSDLRATVKRPRLPSAEAGQDLGIKRSTSPSASSDYLEYLRKLGPLLKQQGHPHEPIPGTNGSSPSGISSAQNQSPTFPMASQDPQLFSRMYLENMMKNAAAAALGSGGNDGTSSALDLTQFRGEESRNQSGDSVKRPPQAESSESNGSTGSTTQESGTMSSTKSRRKGKAFKIERKQSEGQKSGDNSSTASGTFSEPDVDAKSDEVRNSNNHEEHTNEMKELTAGATSLPVEEQVEEEVAPLGKLNGSHVCKYCEIAFMDSIMYSIHMGYHGFRDPFKCNICGEQSEDKVSFFLHIARKPHQ